MIVSLRDQFFQRKHNNKGKGITIMTTPIHQEHCKLCNVSVDVELDESWGRSCANTARILLNA